MGAVNSSELRGILGFIMVSSILGQHFTKSLCHLQPTYIPPLTDSFQYRRLPMGIEPSPFILLSLLNQNLAQHFPYTIESITTKFPQEKADRVKISCLKRLKKNWRIILIQIKVNTIMTFAFTQIRSSDGTTSLRLQINSEKSNLHPIKIS
eukprot:GHVP01030314.1.p1 GENE.GHVP01030314.1~~GHVP01030314.1.p1  ORF type:complete len:151 (-),score=6.93 GHVP01030314.1:492-944(-)